MGGFETQRDFHRVQEHPKKSSDEEVIVVRSWRTQPENPVLRTGKGLLFSIIFGHNMSLRVIKLYMGGLYTKIFFHRVQEFPKRSPNKGVIQIASHEENQ